MLKKIVFLIPFFLFLITNFAIGQEEVDYPINVLYIEGSIYETDDDTFSLLGGSTWSKLSYAYLLPTSDIFIILTSEAGNGIAYSDGSEFNVKYLSGGLDYKRGKLNLVIESLGDGAILKMADDSLWEIDSYDQYDTGYWLPPYHVIITSDELYLINFEEGKKIWGTKAN